MNKKPQAPATFEKRDTFLTVRIPETLKQELASEAVTLDRTLSHHVVKVIVERGAAQRVQGGNTCHNVLHRLSRIERLARSCASDIDPDHKIERKLA